MLAVLFIVLAGVNVGMVATGAPLAASGFGLGWCLAWAIAFVRRVWGDWR